MLPSLFQPKLIFVRLLNSLLGQEPWAMERTRQHAGKNVKFQLLTTTLALVFERDGKVRLAEVDSAPNVKVTLASEHVPAIIKELGNGGIGTDGLDVKRFMSYVHIEGDAGLANLVSDLARDLRWDRHYHMANLLGPILTSHLLRTEQFVLDRGREHADQLLRAGADVLSHEQEVLLAKVHFNDLNRQLETLDKRIKELEKNSASALSNVPVGVRNV